MRDAGKVYLPQEPAETAAAYDNRLSRTVLTNLYKKTADKLVGKPLKKGVKLGDDVPPAIAIYIDNIDNQGTSLDVFSRKILTAAIDDGVTHILVDYSDTSSVLGAFPDGSLTLEQERTLGIRPYARHIKAADLIGWKWRIENNRRILTQVRIKEYVRTDVDEFTQKIAERIRVIEPNLVRVYEKVTDDEGGENGKQQWELIELKETTMSIIPMVTFYTNRKGFMIGEPLLLDIAYLNVAHWQSDSDQRNILHIARVPILAAFGFGDDDSQVAFEIGSNTFVRGPTGASLQYVEHSGKGIESGSKDLKELEERIQLLGMELLVKRPTGNVTATARTLDQVEADSALGTIAKELENALGKMLDLYGLWLGLGADGGGTVEVFKDFSIESEDLQDVELLLRARMAREISQQTFWKEIKRRGLISDDFNPQDEVDLLDIESGGTTNVNPDINEAEGDDDEGRSKENQRRNRPGDRTSTTDGHSHILEANGLTSVYTNPVTGESHTHTWDELGIRTSVDDGHSHMLLTRATAGSHVGEEDDGNSSEGIEDEGTSPAGEGGEVNQQVGT